MTPPHMGHSSLFTRGTIAELGRTGRSRFIWRPSSWTEGACFVRQVGAPAALVGLATPEVVPSTAAAARQSPLEYAEQPRLVLAERKAGATSSHPRRGDDTS